MLSNLKTHKAIHVVGAYMQTEKWLPELSVLNMIKRCRSAKWQSSFLLKDSDKNPP